MEIDMSREILSYTISNAVSGHCLGVYEGTSRDDALDTLARAAGYADFADYRAECEVNPALSGDELIVVEIEQN